MNNSNLGKGLGELLGQAFTNLKSENNIIDLDITIVQAGKYQPRLNINEIELEDLTNSIKDKGVIQPILVKFDQELGKYNIIAGERRYRASLKAGLTIIPAVILEIEDAAAYELAIIENIQREQLNVIEEAKAIENLMQQYEYTQEEIAKRLGKTRSHIANLLRLLSLPQEVQDMVVNKQISMGHARALIKKENALELAQQIIAQNLSVRDVEKIVKNKSKGLDDGLVLQHDQQKKLYLGQIAEKFTELLQYKTMIKHNGRKGKLIIEYKNIADLENLLERFN